MTNALCGTWPLLPHLFTDLAYALGLFLAVVAIFSDDYTTYGLALGILLAIWYMVQTLGASRLTVLLVLTLVITVRVLSFAAAHIFDISGDWNLVSLLDSLLSDDPPNRE